jgi:pilus assembly protein CpaB
MAPDDVQILARARISGTLSLALRSIADGKTSNDVVSTVDSKLVTVYRGAVIADVLNCNPLCTRR